MKNKVKINENTKPVISQLEVVFGTHYEDLKIHPEDIQQQLESYDIPFITPKGWEINQKMMERVDGSFYMEMSEPEYYSEGYFGFCEIWSDHIEYNEFDYHRSNDGSHTQLFVYPKYNVDGSEVNKEELVKIYSELMNEVNS